MTRFQTLRQEWFSNPRGDLLSGIVVAFALIPEAIGFSVIAGVDPAVGLYASFSIAVIIALVGGRPGMISAATAAIAVLVVPLVRDHGVQFLFAATILMGFIQFAVGFLRVDRLMRYVSRSVITGFVNALAILIFMAQLPELINVTPITYVLVAAALAIIYLLPPADERNSVAARGDRDPDIAGHLFRYGCQPCGRHGRFAHHPFPISCVPDVPFTTRDVADHPALFGDHGCRRASRKPDDRADRGRPHR